MTGTRRQEPTISEMISKYSEAMSAGGCDRFGRKPPTRVLWGIQAPEDGIVRHALTTPVVDPAIGDLDDDANTANSNSGSNNNSNSNTGGRNSRNSQSPSPTDTSKEDAAAEATRAAYRHRRPRAPRYGKRPALDAAAKRYSVGELPNLRSRLSLQAHSSCDLNALQDKQHQQQQHHQQQQRHMHGRSSDVHPTAGANTRRPLPPVGPPVSRSLPNIFQRSPTLNIADALSVSAVTPHAAAPASNASPVSTCTGAESKRESLAFLSDAPLRRQRSRSTSSSRHTAVQEVDEEEDEDTSTTTTATTSASTLHGDIDALFAGVHVVGVRADSSVSPAQRRRRRSNSKGHAHTMMQRQQQYQQYQQQHARISNSSGSGSGSGLGVDGGVGLEKRSPIKRASPPARPKADVFSFDAKTVQNYHDKIRDRLTS